MPNGGDREAEVRGMKRWMVLCLWFVSVCLTGLAQDELIINVEKAGKLKKVLSKESLENAHSLTIVGEINGTDILTLKEMPFLRYLDLRKCHIRKGGKVYYRDKYRKLKLKTQDNIFTPYLFDSSFKLLRSIVLPESLLSIEENGINLNLNSIHITSCNTKFSRYLYFNSETNFIFDSYEMMNGLFVLDKLVEHIKICSGAIKDEAFWDYKNLKSIVLDENVSFLGKAVFKGCTNLKNVDIYSSISELKESTFEDCKALKTIKLRYGLEKINDRCFYGCSSLIDVDVPNTVLQIGNSAFEGCKSLSEFIFPKELFRIGNRSFANTGLMSIKLPISLSYIGNHAWDKCPLKRIEYPKNILDIGNNEFSSIEDISIYMNSIRKPLGSINGLYTTLFVPNGSFENYQNWSDQAYIVDIENPICKTIDLDKGCDLRTVRYADTLKICGKMDSESFSTLVENIRMVKCLNLSKVKYVTSDWEIGIAHSTFLEEEKKRKSDKALSELVGLLAAETSLYAEYFMDPLTGTMTKIIADEVEKSMDEDVNKYKEGVFYADTVKNNLILSDNLFHIRNLVSIYLPSGVDNLWVDWRGRLPLNLYVNNLPYVKLDVKRLSNVKFFIPVEYKQYVKSDPAWKTLIYNMCE